MKKTLVLISAIQWSFLVYSQRYDRGGEVFSKPEDVLAGLFLSVIAIIIYYIYKGRKEDKNKKLAYQKHNIENSETIRFSSFAVAIYGRNRLNGPLLFLREGNLEVISNEEAEKDGEVKSIIKLQIESIVLISIGKIQNRFYSNVENSERGALKLFTKHGVLEIVFNYKNESILKDYKKLQSKIIRLINSWRIIQNYEVNYKLECITDVRNIQKYIKSHSISVDSEDFNVYALINKQDVNDVHFAYRETLESQLKITDVVEDVSRRGVKVNSDDALKENIQEKKNILQSKFDKDDIEHLFRTDNRAERYILEAREKLFGEDNYDAAIELIDKGLKLEDHMFEPFLYRLRSECNESQKNYSDSIEDMDEAIKSLRKLMPEKHRHISDFFKQRADYKKYIGDDLGACIDQVYSNNYLEKSRIVKSDRNLRFSLYNNIGDIVVGAKKQQKEAYHPIIYIASFDDDFFIGGMLTHSKGYGNILLNVEHFEIIPEKDFERKSYFVNSFLLKKKEWGPFKKIGNLSGQGIDFILDQLLDCKPIFWEDYRAS